MSEIPRDTEIRFVTSREVESGKLSGFLSYGAKLGLVTGFTIEDEPLEDQLKRHLETNPIDSLESYLGKEHFWGLGQKAGVSRANAGRLFGILERTIYTTGLSEDLGLNIVSREQVGLPIPPPLPPLRPLPKKRDRYYREVDPVRFVIQADGIVELSRVDDSILSLPESGIGAQKSLAALGEAISVEVASHIQPQLFE
ncbi:MAG TPA: hypothetical protein VIH90_05675 [Candidatus Saccharimonadales bacterium]